MGFLGDNQRKGKEEGRIGAEQEQQASANKYELNLPHSSSPAFDPSDRLRPVGHALVCNEGADGIGFRARNCLDPSRGTARSQSGSLGSRTVGICRG
jgi:hypothetical protein